MDQRLEQELQNRRSERCPRRVLHAVRAEIRPRSNALPKLAFAAVVIACIGVAIFQFRTNRLNDDSATRIASAQPSATVDAEQTVRETYAAIAFFGRTLLEAGEKSGRVILEKTGESVNRGLTGLNNSLTKNEN